MRALRVSAVGGTPQLEEVPEPVPGPGETLLRIAGACLAHVDRSIAAGSLGGTPPLPYVPCTDGAGWVVSSSAHPPGALVWVRGAGVGVTRDGVAAELAVVPDAAVHAMPDGADPLLAACFFSPATSAATALADLGRLQAGERVLVTGAAGAVGSLTVQLALAAGAEVVACVRTRARAAGVPDGAEVVVGEPGPVGADLLVDTVGGPGLAGRLSAVRPGGRAVLVGYTAGTTVQLDLPALLRADVALLPLNMIRRAPEAFARAGDLLARLAAGELHLAVTRYDLADAAAAWADLGAGRVDGRAVLVPAGRSGSALSPALL
ncbi:quinone oxidoreductase family protein [Geodermatophilus sp. SYSU D00700]